MIDLGPSYQRRRLWSLAQYGTMRGEFAGDSPLEEAGFEPLVPRHAVKGFESGSCCLRLISRRPKSRL